MNKRDQIKAARELGSKAKAVGQHVSENPYGIISPLNKAWNDGWMKGNKNGK